MTCMVEPNCCEELPRASDAVHNPSAHIFMNLGHPVVSLRQERWW